MENVSDPVAPIEEILKKVVKNDLLVHYKIPDFNSPTEFLINVAMARGKLNKVWLFLFNNLFDNFDVKKLREALLI